GGQAGSVEQILFTGEPVNIYMDKRIAGEVAKLSGVEKVSAQFFTQTLNESCCSLQGVNRLVGIDPDTDFVLQPWLKQASKGLEDKEVIVGALAPAPLGERVIILGQSFTIVDRLEPVGGSTDTTIFINIERARQLAAASPYLKGVWQKGKQPADLISAVLVKAANPKAVRDIAVQINQMPTAKASVASEVMRTSKEQLSTLLMLTGGLAMSLWVVCLLSLTSRFATLVMERKQEMGLLRAIGARRSDIFGLVIVEAVLTTCSGGAAGVAAGIYLLFRGRDFLQARTTFPFLSPSGEILVLTAALTVVLSVAAGLLASWYPAYRCSAMDPVTAISEGELE
ncbi:MAG TPA: FtsX-like permease family protein, partial [Bacillota bacterium]|nr:FtsX-like permease family protein [Bacillota bacterium]